MTVTAEVKEKSLILSGAKVRAVLEGRKTQERLPLKPQPLEVVTKRSGSRSPRVTRTLNGHLSWAAKYTDDPVTGKMIYCRHGEVGDRLWVREAMRCDQRGMFYDADGTIIDKDRIPDNLKRVAEWNDPFHMPRWASRLTLEITNIRVERIQDISRADAIAEGVDPFMGKDETAWRAGFQIGWNEINGKRAPWESNPWCWVLDFKKL